MQTKKSNAHTTSPSGKFSKSLLSIFEAVPITDSLGISLLCFYSL